MSKKDPLIFVEHILENIEDIEKFSKGIDKEELEKDSMRQKAIIRSIEIIGEAVKNLPKGFRDKHNSIPWTEIVGMRDKLIHNYFGINLDNIWEVIKEDIPILKENMLKIKGDFKKSKLSA